MEIPAVLGTIRVWEDLSTGTSNHLYLNDNLNIANKPAAEIKANASKRMRLVNVICKSIQKVIC